jgi:hypothetical protein
LFSLSTPLLFGRLRVLNPCFGVKLRQIGAGPQLTQETGLL